MAKKPFGTIICDPPWSYGDSLTDGGVGREYKTLSIEEMKPFAISDFADYLFLWTTSPILADGSATELVKAWGFQPITLIYWLKAIDLDHLVRVRLPGTEEARFQIHATNKVMGYWFQGVIEPVLVCKVPDAKSIKTKQIGLLAKHAEHSCKPKGLHWLVERFFPEVYLEMFARDHPYPKNHSHFEKWTVIGNEAPGDGWDIRDRLAEIRKTSNPPKKEN